MFRKKKSSEKLPPAAAGGTATASATAPVVPRQEGEAQTSAAQPTLSKTASGGEETAAQPPSKAPTAAVKQQASAPAPPATEAQSVSPRLVDKTARKAKGAKGFFKRAPTIVGIRAAAAEATRLKEDKERAKNWKRWGPYLSERQWATVREDYSADGSW